MFDNPREKLQGLLGWVFSASSKQMAIAPIREIIQFSFEEINRVFTPLLPKEDCDDLMKRVKTREILDKYIISTIKNTGNKPTNERIALIGALRSIRNQILVPAPDQVDILLEQGEIDALITYSNYLPNSTASERQIPYQIRELLYQHSTTLPEQASTPPTGEFGKLTLVKS